MANARLRAWSKPHACRRACPARGKSSSYPGIVRPADFGKKGGGEEVHFAIHKLVDWDIALLGASLPGRGWDINHFVFNFFVVIRFTLAYANSNASLNVSNDISFTSSRSQFAGTVYPPSLRTTW